MSQQGLITTPGFKYSGGIAYIAIPRDLDRDKYIRDCFANNYVSMRTEDGGFHNRIPVPPEVLNFLEFPTKVDELGSPVVYITDQQYNHHYIVNRYERRDSIGDNSEHKFKFTRQLESSHVEISGSVKDGAVNILIDSFNKKGSFNLNVYNANKDCQANIDIQGNIVINSSNNVEINQSNSFKVVTTDEDDNSSSYQQTASENRFYNKKFIVNDGKEPMVLGDQLNDFIDSLINTLTGLQTVDQKPLSPASITKLNALKAQVKKIKSTEAFLKT